MSVWPVGRWLGAVLGVLATGLLAGCAAVGQQYAGASEGGVAAMAATLEARPVRAAPNEAFSLLGEHFVGRYVCDDVGRAGSEEDVVNSSPARGIRVELRQDGRAWRLGTVDAGRKLAFDARFEVPADARPGRAVIRAVGEGADADGADADETAEASFRVLGERPGESSSGPTTSRIILSAGGHTEVGATGGRIPPAEEAIEVSAGSGMALGLGPTKPSSVRAEAMPLDGESEPDSRRTRELRVWRTGERTLIRPSLPPGDYVLEASTANPSEGRASHGFRLRVEPTREQLLREESLSRRGAVGGVCGFGMDEL